ncbi:hypothetical protein [Pseudomonas fluorescens]|uniref:DUF4352 domain-containing protein n=1 Tax=Pseudomonas fluorescens TaxID=294 RepID=A0A5E7QPF6_PSEFL|nr:hypothetical protein [Pseudomonas fluorescens]VVP60763.1 hypothetical protein PS880_06198 [Pseudomonas fluorescens]
MTKKTLWAPALLMISFFTAPAFSDTPAPESSMLRDSASSVMSSLISTGKNLVGGITDGVTKGRESTESSDGAVVLSGLEPMTEMLIVELLSVEPPKSPGMNVLIGFKNNTNKPVRVINLKQTGALLVIEQGGYSRALLQDLVNPDEVTIPANTGVRQNFVFEDSVKDIKSVRIFGKDWVLVK